MVDINERKQGDESKLHYKGIQNSVLQQMQIRAVRSMKQDG